VAILKNSKVLPLRLKGDNFEIGRGLGRYWGDYFGNLNKISKRNECLYGKYKDWLQDSEIDEGRGRFLTNMVQHFPALFDELVGMNVGINESNIGFNTSLFGLFTCWLGETDEEYLNCSGCSTVLLPIKNGFYLAHSDEESDDKFKQLPLVVADVSLETDDKHAHFISISHPFQLFGSAVGMNHNLAFQGNSITYNEEISRKLEKTWEKRIPKTVFTRMMLEMSGIKEIKALYNNYGSTLPNHHYVVFRDKAYSIEVKPTDKKELIVCEMEGEEAYIHTNHFLKDDSGKWVDEYKNESPARLKFLKEKINGVKSAEEIQRIFQEFLEEYLSGIPKNKLINRTSGAFFFTVEQDKPLSCEGELYFDNNSFSASTRKEKPC